MEKTPIVTKQINAKSRVYYLDVFKDRKDQPYLEITEIPKDKSPGIKERKRIVIFPENIGKFAKALFEVSGYLTHETEG